MTNETDPALELNVSRLDESEPATDAVKDARIAELEAEADRSRWTAQEWARDYHAQEAATQRYKAERDALANLLWEIRNAAANSGTNANRAWDRIFTAIDHDREDGGSSFLARRDAETAAAAWDEGHRAAIENTSRDIFEDGERITNPYRAARYREETR